MDSFVDTGMDTATEWGNDCIKTNLPKVLDQMSSYVKELFASIISQNNNSIRENGNFRRIRNEAFDFQGKGQNEAFKKGKRATLKKPKQKFCNDLCFGFIIS